MYTRYQSGAIIQFKNTANGKDICPHPLVTRPMQTSPLWKEVQNANYKNHSILHQVFEPATEK